MDWLLKGEMPAEYPTYALAHYAGRYDMHFVLGELYRQGGIKPRLIKKGEKLYQVTIERKNDDIPKTVFRDTYNLMPVKLENMPSSLGLQVEVIFLASEVSFTSLYSGQGLFPSQVQHLRPGEAARDSLDPSQPQRLSARANDARQNQGL